MRAKVGKLERRQAAVLVAVFGVLALFAGQLVNLQVVSGPALAADALNNRLRTSTLPAQRGDIVDRNGAVMATSVERVKVIANQKQIPDFKRTDSQTGVTYQGAQGVAALLAPILNLDEATLAADLTGDAGYKVVASGLPLDTWLRIAELGVINGISPEYYSQRAYPAGPVAGHLLGFPYENSDEPGVTQWSGLEGTQDATLAGIDGQSTTEVGIGGKEIPGGEQTVTPATPGSDVVLTIDRDLQAKTQDLLDAQVAAMGAQWGTVIIAVPQTGEILALADSGTMDPNNPTATPAADRGSRAVQAAFDPGSTAKTMTMSALLESGLATPLTPVVAPDAYTTSNGQVFHDSYNHRVYDLTLTGVLERSSNTGTVTIGQSLPLQTRYDNLVKFGMGKPTGIELPGESSGILNPVDQWDGRTQYAVLFGQGYSATALQMTQVYNTIANDGVMMPLHLVKSTRDEEGRVTDKAVGQGTQVIDKSTSDQLRSMLETVVAGSPNQTGSIPGYRVGGKTGTAQTAGADGQLSLIVSSFIGVVPIDSPQLTITAVIYGPTADVPRAQFSVPLFQKVGAMALQHLGIAPTGTEPVLYPTMLS